MESYEQAPQEEFPQEAPPKAVRRSPFENSPYEMPHQNTDVPQQEAPTPAPPANKNRKPWKAVLSWICILALIAGSCGLTAFGVNSYWQNRQAQTNSTIDRLYQQLQNLQEEVKDNSFTGNGNSVSGSTNVSPDGLTPGQVYAKCADTVVAIVAQSPQSGSAGSGFIISENGYIMTNYHVIEGSTSITVTVHDGTEYPATAIGYDDTNDIALIKIEAQGLPYATLGSSDDLIVGDQVVAIGNALGELSSTLTVGYISAKERDVTTDGTIINMLQTDAAINAGNSGGPLLNMKGEVVGIITAKYSGSTPSGTTIEGIGFAIPMDDIVDKIDQIKEHGYVSTPYLGIMVDNRNQGVGAYVISVEPDGAAKAAGMRPGDIIVALGDTDVNSIEDISKALRHFKVGDTTTVTVYRSRTIVELTITFGEKPKADSQTSTDDLPDQSGDSQYPEDDFFESWWDSIFGN